MLPQKNQSRQISKAQQHLQPKLGHQHQHRHEHHSTPGNGNVPLLLNEWKPSSSDASGRRGNSRMGVKTQKAGEGELNGMETG